MFEIIHTLVLGIAVLVMGVFAITMPPLHKKHKTVACIAGGIIVINALVMIACSVL